MSDWKSIDTAPKDGTKIKLAWFDGDELVEWFTMQWGHVQKNGLFPSNIGMWVSPDRSFTWNGTPEEGGPTHWMPASKHPRE